MKGSDFKKIAKMHLDAYIKDDEEYYIEIRGSMSVTFLKATEIEKEMKILE